MKVQHLCQACKFSIVNEGFGQRVRQADAD